MSDILVSLDRILANPYQTRLPRPADDEHVASLAADIQARGLLQVPLARLVDAAGVDTKVIPAVFFLPVPQSQAYAEQVALLAKLDWYIQLACGHNRLAAYRLLAKKDPGNGWDRLPMRLALLDDQAMALAAWSENEQRNDLSPLEKAQALQRFMADFGWTQEQVGEHCGLNRATVANKLRLLRLPEALQTQLHRGDLSERQALAVLPIYELPPAAQAEIEKKRTAGHDYTIERLDDAVKHPDKKSSGDVRTIIRDAVRHITQPLATANEDEWGRAGFPVDQEIAGVAAPACLACANRLQETRCADAACFAQKQAVFERQELAFAVAATGLPGITTAEFNALPPGAKKHFDASDRAGLERALQRQCPNLRLRYEREEPRPYSLRHPDYPHAGYVCVHAGDGLCECADGARAKREAQEKAAQERRQKEAHNLREAAVKELTAALRDQDLGAWHAVLWGLRSNSYHNSGSADKVAGMDANTTLENIARAVARDAVRWDYPRQDDAAADLAAWREKVGWAAAPDQAAETEAANA